jgi:osmotically-inducible protein OsmY
LQHSPARRCFGRKILTPIAGQTTLLEIDDVKVASVNNGVVLLSGKAANLTETLRAIENAYSVNGVHRVASEIQTIEN